MTNKTWNDSHPQYKNPLDHRCSNFSTQPQRDRNNSSHGSSSISAAAQTTDGDDDVYDEIEGDDDHDEEEIDDDNDNNNNTANSSIFYESTLNTKQTNDVFFKNIDLDDLELPPNPDIPPPKVRTPYPIIPPPSSQNDKSKRAAKNDTDNVLANERLVAQIMFLMKKRGKKGNAKQGGGNHHHRQYNNSNMTADDVQVRVVPDVLLSKVHKSVESIKEPTATATSAGLESTNTNHDGGDGSTDEDDSTAGVKEMKGSSSKNKTKTIVVTLSEAIKMSIEQGKDLVEVSIDQDVPVVMISNVKGIAYQNAKSKKTIKVTNAASSQVKEVTMQAGIAANDLQRKVNDIFKFLDKGHMCIVSIRINRKQNRENINAPEAAIKQILPLLEDKVEMVVRPEINPLRTMVSFRVRGNKK